MRASQHRTAREVRANGSAPRPRPANPWTEAFDPDGQRADHGANGHNGSRPAHDEADTATRDALMQCYNG